VLHVLVLFFFFFFFQAEDGIRDKLVTGVQTCALPISAPSRFVGENRRLLAPQQRIRALPERQDRRLIQDVAELLLERQPDVVLRSEEHTSELQSLAYLVCRLLLEKKKQQQIEQLV